MKLAAKDFFYAMAPPVLSNLVLPRIFPGASPFKAGILDTGVIFIHVPKAAGSSIKTEIYGKPQFGHRRIAEFYGYDRTRTDAFFKFAFVRNPWDRLLSAFTYLRQDTGNSSRDRRFARDYLKAHFDFAAFVTALENPAYRRAVMVYDHFRPYSYWICRPGEAAHAMDFLGRFEQIDADMNEVRARLGRPRQELPRVRLSAHGLYRDVYTTRMRDTVTDVYSADLRLAEYDF